MGFKTVVKTKVENKNDLAIVYTPGVAAACRKISENSENSFVYTNRKNTVAVFAFDYDNALKRAEFIKSEFNLDGIPLCIDFCSREKILKVCNFITPTFGAFDFSLIKDVVCETPNTEIPSFIDEKSANDFFQTIKNTEKSDDTGNNEERALALRKINSGVIGTVLTENHTKPVGIITDGTAVLGLGNIGAEAGLPVMEGKAALFSVFGDVSAIPLCVRTKNIDDFIETVTLLKNSFSAINLEDIAAPHCFEIEKKLNEILDMTVFHDDAHGTAIVVTAGIINALKLTGKDKSEVKTVISGAGAAGTTTAKLLLKFGIKNIIACDRNGALYRGGKYIKPNHEELSKITNPYNIKGSLKEVIKDADIFIGLSAPELLDEGDIGKMKENATVFALANPVPEIMPARAKKGGAFIVASGRSDFKNQINNCLAFPGIFNGVLKYNLKKLTDDMKLQCAYALAGTVTNLSQNKIIPDIFDKKVVETVANALR